MTHNNTNSPEAKSAAPRRIPKLAAALHAACLCGAASLLSFPAAADNGVDLSLLANVTHVTNVDQIPTGGRDDNIGGVGLLLDYLGQGPRYSVYARATGTYLDYLSKTFASKVRGAFAGDATFTLVPEHVTWEFRENFGPTLEDPLSSDRPDNWAYDSYFVTGPAFAVNLGSRNLLTANLLYGRTDYQNQAVPGNHYYLADLAVAHPSGPHSGISLHVSDRDTMFDNGAQPVPLDIGNNFRILETYVRCAANFSRTGLVLDAGGTKLSESGSSGASAPLLRLDLTHKLSAHISVEAQVGTQYADTLDRLQLLQNQTANLGATLQNIAPVAAALKEKFAETLIQVTGTRTEIGLRARYDDVQYQKTVSELANQTFSDLTLEVDRRLTSVLRAYLAADRAQRQFLPLTRKDTDLAWTVGLDLQTTRKVHWVLSYQHLSRTSTDPTQEFHNSTAMLQVIYQALKKPVALRPALFKNEGVF